MILLIPSEMPATRSLGKGKHVLLESWRFVIIIERVDGKRDVHECVVPKGFITDFYSVPWPLTLFIPRDEHDNRPSIMHDWLFATCGLRETADSPSVLSRGECNDVLDLACNLCSLPRIRQWSIPTGVRIGSWVVWNRLVQAGHSIANPKLD